MPAQRQAVRPEPATRTSSTRRRRRAAAAIRTSSTASTWRRRRSAASIPAAAGCGRASVRRSARTAASTPAAATATTIPEQRGLRPVDRRGEAESRDQGARDERLVHAVERDLAPQARSRHERDRPGLRLQGQGVHGRTRARSAASGCSTRARSAARTIARRSIARRSSATRKCTSPRPGPWSSLTTWEDDRRHALGAHAVLGAEAPEVHGAHRARRDRAAAASPRSRSRTQGRRAPARAGLDLARQSTRRTRRSIANGVVFAFGNGVDATQSTRRHRPDLQLVARTARTASTHAELHALRRAHRRGAVVERRPDRHLQPLHQPVARQRPRLHRDARRHALRVRRRQAGGDPLMRRRHDDSQAVARRPRARHLRPGLGAGWALLARGQAREWTTSGFDAQRTALGPHRPADHQGGRRGRHVPLPLEGASSTTRRASSNRSRSPSCRTGSSAIAASSRSRFVGGSGDRLFAIDTDLALPYWTTHLTYAAATGSIRRQHVGLPRRPRRHAQPAHAARTLRVRRRGRRGRAAARAAPSASPARAPRSCSETRPQRQAAATVRRRAAAAGRSAAQRAGRALRRRRSAVRDGQRRPAAHAARERRRQMDPPVPFLPPNARPSSLVFVDGLVYTTHVQRLRRRAERRVGARPALGQKKGDDLDDRRRQRRRQRRARLRHRRHGLRRDRRSRRRGPAAPRRPPPLRQPRRRARSPDARA